MGGVYSGRLHTCALFTDDYRTTPGYVTGALHHDETSLDDVHSSVADFTLGDNIVPGTVARP